MYSVVNADTFDRPTGRNSLGTCLAVWPVAGTTCGLLLHHCDGLRSFDPIVIGCIDTAVHKMPRPGACPPCLTTRLHADNDLNGAWKMITEWHKNSAVSSHAHRAQLYGIENGPRCSVVGEGLLRTEHEAHNVDDDEQNDDGLQDPARRCVGLQEVVHPTPERREFFDIFTA